jgi:hypothetical protein
MSVLLQEYAQKAGSELLDFIIDYTDDLSETYPVDDIITSSWTVVGSDLVIVDDTIFTWDTATVWVSGGGRVGDVHRLTNTVTTMAGRTFVRTLLVKMVLKYTKTEDEDLVTLETPSIP